MKKIIRCHIVVYLSTYLFSFLVSEMGRLNKKLSKVASKTPRKPPGLSSSAAKALLSVKTETIQTDISQSEPAPVESFSSLVKSSSKIIKDRANIKQQQQQGGEGNKKKFLKTIQRDGKIVKLKKKEKMKLRAGLLVKKLALVEEQKKENKARKKRENVVIVKDTKPLLDNLLEIETQIEKEVKQKEKEKKLKSGIKKPSKAMLKQKNQKDQFMKDIEFLKAASKHPEYVKNPIETISTHIKNTID